MALLDTILKKVKSNDSIRKKLSSPPPEINATIVMKPKNKKRVHRYAHVTSRVDSYPPRLDSTLIPRHLPQWSLRLRDLYGDNLLMVMRIKRQYYLRGRVDSWWKKVPPRQMQYEENRTNFLKHVAHENQHRQGCPHSVFTPRLAANRRTILNNAQAKFVLFPPVPREDIEDSAFAPPHGVTRPKVYLKIRVRGGADIGELAIEVFTDVCPITSELFLDLVRGDSLGYGYVGTTFFRKVPNLYWSGGDVVYDNGFGCYAQRGRVKPIGAENYHFPHSMPGLVSMRVTRDNEVCGCFSITFKPLPQFDLHNVVFGRVIRPSRLYEGIRGLGSPLSSYPSVDIIATRYQDHTSSSWKYGLPNTKLSQNTPNRQRRHDFL